MKENIKERNVDYYINWIKMARID